MTRPSTPTAADVAVIGGGPSGATAARLLADWGHSVVLVTRPAPRHALAESLPPSCVRLFDRVGIRGAIDGAGFIRSTGNTVRWGAHAERVEQFGEGVLGYQVARDAFDELLLVVAQAAGALVIRDATVHTAVSDGGRSTVTYDSGGDPRSLSVGWVLDCTGRAGLVGARRWRREEPASRTLALVGVWERDGGFGMSDETHTLVESYDDGWGWSVPVSPSRRYLTAMVDPSLTAIRGGEELTAIYRAELARTTALRGLSDGARLIDEAWARDASPYSASQAGEDGLLQVGDAVSFVDPLSSYGVKKALASAWLAAVVAHTCLENRSLVGPALELYEARERSMVDQLRRRTAELSREAARAHQSDFWLDRAEGDDLDTDSEPDIALLRVDPRVLAAFEELRQRPSLALRAGHEARRIQKATVQRNKVVLVEHLAAPRFPAGVRYLRGIDVVLLSELAISHDQVPNLYEAYNRAGQPATLPDFLGALSVLVGMEILVFA